MLETDRSVTAEIKLYYDLFVPDESSSSPAPLLISVHGYGAHKRYMMREARLIAPEDFVIVSLEAPNRFWREAAEGEFRPAFGWLTDVRAEESVALHQRFILDVIDRLAEERLIDREHVFLYGFSQACALNFRFALTHPDALCGLIGVGGGIPSDLDTNPAYRPTEAAVLYLYGTRDHFYPLEKLRKFEQKLVEYLPDFEAKSYSAGHEITDQMRTDMRRWLEEKSCPS